MEYKYGWVPQPQDDRDLRFSVSIPTQNLPKSVDLRDKMPPVYNQGTLGSCTACVIGALIDYLLVEGEKKYFMPSRLFIYYNERVMLGTVNEDSGAIIRDGIKSVNKLGVCSEVELPYNIHKFTIRPSDLCYRSAMNCRTGKYKAVEQSENGIKTALSLGFPIAFGFMVKESLQSATVAKTGNYRPKPNEKTMGGHAVVIVGYVGQNVIIRNSWGKSWAKDGYFTMPFSEVLDRNISSDFWIIESML